MVWYWHLVGYRGGKNLDLDRVGRSAGDSDRRQHEAAGPRRKQFVVPLDNLAPAGVDDLDARSARAAQHIELLLDGARVGIVASIAFGDDRVGERFVRAHGRAVYARANERVLSLRHECGHGQHGGDDRAGRNVAGYHGADSSPGQTKLPS